MATQTQTQTPTREKTHAMHFDGAWWADEDWQCRPEVLWRGGTTCFYP